MDLQKIFPQNVDMQPQPDGENGRLYKLDYFDKYHIDNLRNYRFTEEYNNQTETPHNEALKHFYQASPVSKLFFSRLNINTLQEGIRMMVYKKTGEVIERQDEKELLVIMRSIYLQYSRNYIYQVSEQVKQLNSMVLDWAVPRIITEMRARQQYLKDIKQLPTPIDRPQKPDNTVQLQPSIGFQKFQE